MNRIDYVNMPDRDLRMVATNLCDGSLQERSHLWGRLVYRLEKILTDPNYAGTRADRERASWMLNRMFEELAEARKKVVPDARI